MAGSKPAQEEPSIAVELDVAQTAVGKMMGQVFRRGVLGLLLMAACGRVGFDPLGETDGGAGDTSSTPPAAHARPTVDVDTAGVAMSGAQADGTHLVFVDTTPGKNGNLVIFREGDYAAMWFVYVSNDDGATWMRYTVAPTGASNTNVMGGCQDSVTHAFHVTWLNGSSADEYARLVPVYAGGDIVGFNVATVFSFYDDIGDTPGPRDLAEIVDGDGAHRLVFVGTGPATGSTGRYKLAVSTAAAGLQPASAGDFAMATDHTKVATDDQLLPNSYPTGDGPTSYLVSVSSNVASGPTAPIVVVAGLPVDRKLLAWTVTPATASNFVVSAAQTLSTSFGGGTGNRGDASLSLVTTLSGDALIAYTEEAGAASPGLHVARVDAAGAIARDVYPQPTTSPAVRHAVIAADSASRPAVLYLDASGATLGSLLWGRAWLPAAQVASVSAVAGAWSITNVWRPGGVDGFGVYYDAGATNSTTFASVFWQ